MTGMVVALPHPIVGGAHFLPSFNFNSETSFYRKQVFLALSPFESLIFRPKASVCLFSIFISLILLSVCAASGKVSNTHFHCI